MTFCVGCSHSMDQWIFESGCGLPFVRSLCVLLPISYCNFCMWFKATWCPFCRGSGRSLLLGLCVLLLVNGNYVACRLVSALFGLCLLHSTFVLVTFLLLCWCGNVATCVSLFVNLMVVAILFSGSGTCLHGYLFGCSVF